MMPSSAGARVFVIDNYDTFTYNLVQYLGELGADITVRRNDRVTIAEIAAVNPTHLVISPGPCTPNEAGLSMDAIVHFGAAAPAGARRLPRPPGGRPGLRRGRSPRRRARARQDRPDRARRPRRLRRSAGPLHGDPLPLPGRRPRPASHVWSSRRGTPRASSWALRHRELPVHGVQFHPESVLTTVGLDLLRNFLGMRTRR